MTPQGFIPIEMRTVLMHLKRECSIRISRWRRESRHAGSSRATPIALADIEPAPNDASIYFIGGSVDQAVLRLD